MSRVVITQRNTGRIAVTMNATDFSVLQAIIRDSRDKGFIARIVGPTDRQESARRIALAVTTFNKQPTVAT